MRVVAPMELTGFVEAMVDADAFRVATLDHTWPPTLPILMSVPMAIIHIAIVTEYATGKGVGFGRRSFHNVSVAAVLQPGGVWLW